MSHTHRCAAELLEGEGELTIDVLAPPPRCVQLLPSLLVLAVPLTSASDLSLLVTVSGATISESGS